jgi:metal-dependent amidase/aminoacylase/carboxypeptidase family protein
VNSITRFALPALMLLGAIPDCVADAGDEIDVLFIGNVGEEGLGDLRGVKYLFRDDGPQIDALIAVDGGRTQRLVCGGVGSHRYRIAFRGPGGHSWRRTRPAPRAMS